MSVRTTLRGMAPFIMIATAAGTLFGALVGAVGYFSLMGFAIGSTMGSAWVVLNHRRQNTAAPDQPPAAPSRRK